MMNRTQKTLLIGLAIYAIVLLAPAVSADHIDTPDNRCAGAYETDCYYCSYAGGIDDNANSSCNDHAFDYTWEYCGLYVNSGSDGRCLIGSEAAVLFE